MTKVFAKSRQCNGKIKYPTEETAEKGLVFFHGQNKKLNTYTCPHCGYWHVGHKIQPRTLEDKLKQADRDFIDWSQHGDE